MIALIIRRIFQSFIVMLAVALVAFTLFRYVGDPVSQMVGQETSIADMERMREELGLNDPVIIQFARFSWNTLQGKFGISYQLGRPVNDTPIFHRVGPVIPADPNTVGSATKVAGKRCAACRSSDGA